MHDIEPHWNWRNLYTAENDSLSPFFEREYSEFEFSNNVYGYFVHPQWDYFGSDTLYTKIIYADYEDGFVIMEFIGEWNDLLYNDIMHLKRNVIDPLLEEGINKFILIGENVMNFHVDEDSYYEEWFDEVEDGWIAFINCREHVIDEFNTYNLDHYFVLGGKLQNLQWRSFQPLQFFHSVEQLVQKRLGA